MTQHKIDMATAGAVTAMGASGLTLYEALSLGQLAASITATLLGAGYVAWKWHKDIRTGRRRDRRESDRR